MSDAVFDKLVLDEEEQWIEDHLEEFVPAPEWVGKSLREAAKNPPKIHYSEKESKKPVSLRLDSTDIDKLKTIAIDQGLNYQSLIGSVLHRYVAGTLIDIVEARKILAR
ncbi:MAG: hypothetical protein J5857_09075 [Treponema sp.]|nr:hypothetical protein [Treponema sp.]